MSPRLKGVILILLAFTAGLFLAGLQHLVPRWVASPPGHLITVAVDWLAPPLAGGLLAAALLYGMRHKRLLDTERAASDVLAERLAGTERRQALWVVAAAVAHDLKNPLHNLQLLVEEMEADPPRAQALLPRLRDNVQRAVDRLAELARAGQAPDDSVQPLDLSAVLDEMKARFSPSAQASGASVVVDCPRGLSVRADSMALRSAVENVAANALEALGARGRGGRLTLRARAESQKLVELSVEDDGPGIPEPLRARLFTPFVSGSATGTGLGLVIARALARAGGGDLICAETAPGRTRFRFTFLSL